MHVCASEGGQCVEGRNAQSQSPGTRALQMTDMNELGGGGGPALLRRALGALPFPLQP